jgi:hypothetical protein
MQSQTPTNSYIGSSRFFRGRLLSLSTEEISAMIDRMEEEANDVKANCLKMSWHMRGGSTYEDVMNMSFKERTLIAELIKSNLETTQKSKLNFF